MLSCREMWVKKNKKIETVPLELYPGILYNKWEPKWAARSGGVLTSNVRFGQCYGVASQAKPGSSELPAVTGCKQNALATTTKTTPTHALPPLHSCFAAQTSAGLCQRHLIDSRHAGWGGARSASCPLRRRSRNSVCTRSICDWMSHRGRVTPPRRVSRLRKYG